MGFSSKQISTVFVFLVVVLYQEAYAFDQLILEPGSSAQPDRLVALATEHALLEQGCEVKERSFSDQPPISTGTLILRLAPTTTDRTQGRFSGYGVQLDSVLWSASLRTQLIDPESKKILASFEESADERQASSSNGSQDLSAMVTEGQIIDGLTRKLGRQLALKLKENLIDQGICKRVVTVNPAQGATPQIDLPARIEERKPEPPMTDGLAILPSSETSSKTTEKSHAAKVSENSQEAMANRGSRVALVIGNTLYDHIPTLRNPANDAKFISEKIMASGFELVGGAPLMDLSKSKLEKAIADFGRLLSQHPRAVGFFYYAGHGIQVNGSNYLVPTDANPSRIADLSRQAIEVDSLLQEMEDSRTGLNIVVLDACRNNPFGGRGIRESGVGLAQMRAPKGTIIVYATQPGNIAQDGPSGQNSPFAKAMAQALGDADLDLFGTFNKVGLLVANATGGEQQPWISSSPISGRFCFKGCP